MNATTTGFHCWACGRSGNAISFLSELERVSPVTALRWLRERFGSSFVDPISVLDDIDARLSRRQIEARRTLSPIAESLQDERDLMWGAAELKRIAGSVLPEPLEYMFSRGFSGAALESWEVGYDEKSSMLSIPYRNAKGELLGFKGRAWDPQAKIRYMVLGDRGENEKYGFPTFDISRTLFGIHRLAPSPERFVLFEGELNAIAASQAGVDRVAAISGQFLSLEQAKLAKELGDEVVLVFDEAKNARKAAKQLQDSIRVFVAPEHQEDPADMIGRGSPESVLDLVKSAKSSLLIVR